MSNSHTPCKIGRLRARDRPGSRPSRLRLAARRDPALQQIARRLTGTTSKPRAPPSPCSTADGRRDASGCADRRSHPSSAAPSCTVFAEVDLARPSRGAHAVGEECLGRSATRRMDGGVAPGPAGGLRDPRADVTAGSGAYRSPVLALRSRCDRYFLIVPRIPFAVAALGPEGAQLQVGLELGCGSQARLPSVHERHAELVMRLGVVRVRGDRALELLLGVGDLAGVPEDDALIEQRVSIAARRPQGARRAARELARLGAGRRGLDRTSAGRVVDVREAVVGVGVVGLQLDRLLVCRLRPCRSPSSWSAGSAML